MTFSHKYVILNKVVERMSSEITGYFRKYCFLAVVKTLILLGLCVKSYKITRSKREFHPKDGVPFWNLLNKLFVPDNQRSYFTIIKQIPNFSAVMYVTYLTFFYFAAA